MLLAALLLCAAVAAPSSPESPAASALRAPPSPAALALQAALDAAIAAGDPTFSLPPGATYFNAASFNISGARGMAIAGTGDSMFIFAPGFGVNVSNAEVSSLQNVTIDYAPLPYVYGAVTAANASGLEVQLDAASLTFAELPPPHDIYPPGTVFRGGSLLRPVCSWGAPAPAAALGGLAYRVACRGEGVLPGDVFVAATRVGITLSLSNCTGVLVQDVALRAASYMAVTEFQGGGGNTYRRVNISAPSPSRPLGSNADGFHSSGARVGPRLEGVVIKGLLDGAWGVAGSAAREE